MDTKNDKILREASLGFSKSSTSPSDIAISTLKFLTEEQKQAVIDACGVIPYSDDELQRIKAYRYEKDLEESDGDVDKLVLKPRTYRFHYHMSSLNFNILDGDADIRNLVFECRVPSLLDAFNRFMLDRQSYFEKHVILIDYLEEMPETPDQKST